jgi:hypothetical protein
MIFQKPGNTVNLHPPPSVMFFFMQISDLIWYILPLFFRCLFWCYMQLCNYLSEILACFIFKNWVNCVNYGATFMDLLMDFVWPDVLIRMSVIWCKETASFYLFEKMCSVWKIQWFDCLRFHVLLKNFSLIWRRQPGEGLQNLGLCSAPRAFEQGGILFVPHWCDTGPRFFQSYLKDHPIQSPFTTQGDVEIYSNLYFHLSPICRLLRRVLQSSREWRTCNFSVQDFS